MFRIGHGFDVHPFVKDRKLVLCGIEIEHTHGLGGHSDADVAIHALIDALLGAAGLGDIGEHFPDSDPKYKDMDSSKLLKTVAMGIAHLDYKIFNVDITIHAEEPKLSKHKSRMKQKLAKILKCDPAQVNIKATTWEKLGYVGEKKGIAADAVVLLGVADPGKLLEFAKKETQKVIEETKKESTNLFSEHEEVQKRVKSKGTVELFVDGAARGNPGPAGAGGIIKDTEGKIAQEISMFLGNMTNNQAEYQALILGLKDAVGMRPEHLVIYMDSELVVKQVTGEYKVKNVDLKSLHAIVMQQLMSVNSWEIKHIPREKNSVADKLANQALDRERF